ncbi:signal peptidase II [Blattabacterium sp. (Blattella germanica) str. Bge]|uniref:lipoprotein signal peptidase n=1 Tax=Blattabacterium sp. (Blattella germanica) TaxID=624186 RepID=UPI0001BB60F8|nr:lipoprotein signal peptidase [Blattabacterium sp. (Blattella germanica)]ACY40194.1 signal peptidase II [Blattabacterium sp. (Blattella germanica) str. Bge]
MKKIFLIVFSVLLIDQILKVYIKTHFELGSGVSIFPFFWIFFIENPGMAYGFYLGIGYNGKILLSIFRLFLVLLIFFFLYKNMKKESSDSLIIPTSLILSGAIGNFLDSALYGLLFDTGTIYSEKHHKWIPYLGKSKINFFFNEKGYASFMEGCVVDMFYFPIIDTHFPNWIPFFGGFHFQFFKPIFNIADISIFIGVILFFIYRNKIGNVKFL